MSVSQTFCNEKTHVSEHLRISGLMIGACILILFAMYLENSSDTDTLTVNTSGLNIILPHQMKSGIQDHKRQHPSNTSQALTI